MELVNLDDQFAINELLMLEYGICLFYMRYVSFGFVFTGTMEQAVNQMEEINRLQNLWGYMHRN